MSRQRRQSKGNVSKEKRAHDSNEERAVSSEIARDTRRRGIGPLVIVMVALIVGFGGLMLWPPSPDAKDNRNPHAASAATVRDPLPVAPGLSGQRIGGGLEERYRRADPAQDGWDTEVFNGLAGRQLKLLGKLLVHPKDLDLDHLGKLAAPNFSCGELRPKALTSVFEDQAVRVSRGEARADDSSTAYSGPAGLLEAMKELALPLRGSTDSYVKFKLFRVDPSAATIETTSYYLASARPLAGAVQQNATWRCRWKRPVGDSPPLLEWIGVEDYEEVVGRSGGQPLFADCTEAVLGANRSFREELLPHLGKWSGSVERAMGVFASGYHGLAVGDVDGDGLDDLFVCLQGGAPNKLFVHAADGTAVDVSAKAGVDYLDLARSALIVDLDNDGDGDLVVATANGLMMMSNDGTGVFSLETVVQGTSWTSLSAADYDQDGNLDIYACRYLIPYNSDLQLPKPYYDANNGLPNMLLRNQGGWSFTNVTERVGLDQNNTRFSLAASWEDYDNDGDLDLYVANDFGRNNLYRNDGGSFVDVAAAAGVEDISAGMAVSWGDHNNDGLMDIYVSNMFSSAGNRITFQRQFKQAVDQTTRGKFQRHARGNSLFENQGDGTFRDVSAEAGVTMGRWAWSSNFFDLNNDARLDIFVANGFITNEDSKDL